MLQKMVVSYRKRNKRHCRFVSGGAASVEKLLCMLFVFPSIVGAQPPDYTTVAPLFQQHCVVCHRGDGAPLDLQLDSLAHIRKGSRSGAVVIAGDPDNSELIRRIRGTSQPRMPLTGPPFLSAEEIDRIAAWVAAGLPGNDKAVTTTVPRRLPAPGDAVTFADVKPIFLQRCVKCHKDRGLHGRPPEGLRLRTWQQVVSGGERAVVVPGVPQASELIRRIRGESRPRMPFDGPPFLAQAEIRVISDWVAQGAPDADGKPVSVPAGMRVRLQGRLTGQWQLDGLDLIVDSGTRIDKRPGVGDYVEVRGTVRSDGRVHASRIRRR